jgi:DNA repair exonuclease SbcCD nuclease subunit
MNFSFEQLYALMDKEIINHPYDQFCTVIAGDMFHSKLTVTNEYFDTAHGFLQSLASRTPVVIIPGNHDLSLPNKDRLDAISPIVKSLYGKTKFNIQYSKHSEILKSFWRTGELEKNDENIYFHHFSIIDNKDKWPGKASFVSASFNVALYHGSINNSKVDSGWVSRGNQDDISIFDGYDMALLGDIHMSQFLTSTIAYPGSLRQNNFGETLDKGLILWKISDDYKIVQGERIILPQKKYFITFFCKDENDIIEIKDIPKGCRFKVKLTKEINIVEEIKIKNKIQEYYQPSGEPEIILPDDLDDTDIKLEVEENNDILQENFRDIEVQKSLIRRFFNEKNLSNKDFEDLFELDKVYHTSIKTDLMRNIKWTIDKLQWSNLFSYGKDNILDFENYRGTICLVGKNGSGKSSIIDIINFISFN